MRIMPAVAGAVIVTGLAFGTWAGGLGMPAEIPAEIPAAEPAVSEPGHGPEHAKCGKAEKGEKAEKRDQAAHPEGRGPKQHRSPRPGQLKKPHPHGKVVPARPTTR